MGVTGPILFGMTIGMLGIVLSFFAYIGNSFSNIGNRSREIYGQDEAYKTLKRSEAAYSYRLQKALKNFHNIIFEAHHKVYVKSKKALDLTTANYDYVTGHVKKDLIYNKKTILVKKPTYQYFVLYPFLFYKDMIDEYYGAAIFTRTVAELECFIDYKETLKDFFDETSREDLQKFFSDPKVSGPDILETLTSQEQRVEISVVLDFVETFLNEYEKNYEKVKHEAYLKVRKHLKYANKNLGTQAIFECPRCDYSIHIQKKEDHFITCPYCSEDHLIYFEDENLTSLGTEDLNIQHNQEEEVPWELGEELR